MNAPYFAPMVTHETRDEIGPNRTREIRCAARFNQNGRLITIQGPRTTQRFESAWRERLQLAAIAHANGREAGLIAISADLWQLPARF